MRQQPNSPCACGSGMKAKKCHPFGLPVQGPEREPEPETRFHDAAGAMRVMEVMMVGMLASIASARMR